MVEELEEIPEEVIDDIYWTIEFASKNMTAKYLANRLQISWAIVIFVLKELTYDGAIQQTGTWYRSVRGV